MKRLLCLLLAAILCFALCACAQSSIDATADPTDSSASTITDPTQETDASEATEATDSTETTESTDPTETTENTDPTETTESTDPTETTENTDPTETVHVHTWTDATCTTPRTCSTCNATDGSAKGHNWKAATCTKARTCSVCGRSSGYALGHEWVAATYTAPKTCNRCGKTEGSVLPIPTDYFPGVTVTVIAQSDRDVDDDWFYEQIEKKFGCDIVVIEMDDHDVSGYLSYRLERNSLPTIIPTFLPASQVNTLGEQGVFVDVMAPENLAKMPNFAKLFINDKSINQEYMMAAAEDGSHYILPKYNCERDVKHYWVYNETAFKKAGVTWSGDVTNDGFLNMLRALKRYNPNSYPLTGIAWQSTLDRLIYSFGVNNSLAAYDWNTGTWFYGATTDEYYSMMKLLQTAYNEELMDPLFLTPNNNYIELQKDMASHNSYLYCSWLGWMTMHNASYVENGADDHEIPAPTPVGTNGKTFDLKNFESTSGFMINAKDPIAAACAMAIMDWMYDTSKDGGAWLATVGPDEILSKDANGKNCWNPSHTSGDITCEIEDVSQFGMFNPFLTVRYCPESPYFTFNEEEQMAQDIGEKVGYFRAPPVLEITDKEIAAAYDDSRRDLYYMMDHFILENWDRAKFDAWAADFNATYSEVIEYLNG